MKKNIKKKEFWHDIAIDKSWDVLMRLVKEHNVIVIGGWACYLLTKNIKSKDIDIIIDFNELQKIREKYNLKKNDILKKYEIIVDGISVDIYLPFYSEFSIPVNFIQKNTICVEGIRIPKPEILLILKQQAEIQRSESIKGQKDRIDILNLLINTNINFKLYYKLIKKYNLLNFHERLKEIISQSKDEFNYLIDNPRKIKLQKKTLLKKISLK